MKLGWISLFRTTARRSSFHWPSNSAGLIGPQLDRPCAAAQQLNDSFLLSIYTVLIIGVLPQLALGANANNNNPCNETGTLVLCTERCDPGSIVSAGWTPSGNRFYACVGDSFTPPVITASVSDGAITCDGGYDSRVCVPRINPNKPDEPVHYTWTGDFDPPIPTVFTQPGITYYTGKVTATPDNFLCGYLHHTIGRLAVKALKIKFDQKHQTRVTNCWFSGGEHKAADELVSDAYDEKYFRWSLITIEGDPKAKINETTGVLSFGPTNGGRYVMHVTSTEKDCYDDLGIDIIRADIVGYLPGTVASSGAEVSEASEENPEQLQVAVNDDNDDAVVGSHQDYQDDRLGANDDDVVTVTLNPIVPAINSGTLTLSVTPSDAVRVFKSSSAILANYSVDLASPQGDLAALASTPVKLYLEGLKPSAAVQLTLTYVVGGVSCVDTVKLQVMQADLDVDSENDNGYAPAGWTEDEDEKEDDQTLSGKYLGVNDGDMDADGIPNYADGFDAWDPTSGGSDSFVPVALELKAPIDLDKARVEFVYSASDPGAMSRLGAGTWADPYRYVPAPGNLRLWTKDGAANRKKAEVSNSGDFIKAGVSYMASDLGFGAARKVVLYLEGIRSSSAKGDHRIQVNVRPDPAKPLICSDAVRCTAVALDIVTDYNHDRTIDDLDANRATATFPFRFWLNDDKDDGDLAEGNSDLPGQSPGNAMDYVVNGRCDLPDFFPVWLNISTAIHLLSPSDSGVRYSLYHQDNSVRIVYTDLKRDRSGAYLTNSESIYGSSLNKYAEEADSLQITSLGVNLNATVLNRIEQDSNKGILLVEGALIPTTSPIVLEAWKNGSKICAKQIPLSISSVQAMTRWINLRHLTGGSEIDPTDTSPPQNFPDAESNGKHVIFIAGFNNTEKDHRASSVEVYKRLYWSGSKAMYTGVSWEGNEDPLGILWPVAISYHLDVRNAFDISAQFANNVTALSGQKHVIAHSLGNMVVSSAIEDYGLNITSYFMIDAAIAIEAFNSSQLAAGNMRPANWIPYFDRTWAANWHKLWRFNTSDNRNQLTWLNRFGDIPYAFNFYSSGEEVLQNSPADPSMDIAGKTLSWAFQELIKGRRQALFLPDEVAHGGWGFNELWLPPDAPDAGIVNHLPDDTLRIGPVFKPFYDVRLHSYDPIGSQLAGDYTIRARLLAEAIPALSFAVGCNPVTLTFSENRDMMMRCKNGAEWPLSRIADPDKGIRWLHGDYRDVAYYFVFPLYDDICSPARGGLQ